jgi:V/A-type H+-transporting ATPase subunit F
MSEQLTKKAGSGRIAVIGDRELVVGYRLIGVEDTFLVSEDALEVKKTLQQLLSSKEYALIIASQTVRNALSGSFRESVESSIEPLVLFMPAFEGNVQEESISSLAKRVLGISIQMS